MFKYFDLTSSGFLDVWKKIDISDIKETDDFVFHDMTNDDNLMRISNQYYKTINDWWVLFLFNGVYDVNFFIPTDNTIQTTANTAISNLENYSDLISSEKVKVKANVYGYFRTFNDTVESISLTMSNINSQTEDFKNNYKEYIIQTLTNESFFSEKIKIPNSNVVYQIKNRLDKLSVEWKK